MIVRIRCLGFGLAYQWPAIAVFGNPSALVFTQCLWAVGNPSFWGDVPCPHHHNHHHHLKVRWDSEGSPNPNTSRPRVLLLLGWMLQGWPQHQSSPWRKCAPFCSEELSSAYKKPPSATSKGHVPFCSLKSAYFLGSLNQHTDLLRYIFPMNREPRSKASDASRRRASSSSWSTRPFPPIFCHSNPHISGISKGTRKSSPRDRFFPWSKPASYFSISHGFPHV